MPIKFWLPTELPEGYSICKEQDMTYEEWMKQTRMEAEWWGGIAYGANLAVEVERLDKMLTLLDDYFNPQEPEKDALTPPWESAPEWAEYWVVDQNGTAWWFSEKPECIDNYGIWVLKDLIGRVAPVNPDAAYTFAYNRENRIELNGIAWTDTLRQRGK